MTSPRHPPWRKWFIARLFCWHDWNDIRRWNGAECCRKCGHIFPVIGDN